MVFYPFHRGKRAQTFFVSLIKVKHLVSLNELAVQKVSLNLHQSINLSVGNELGHLDQDQKGSEVFKHIQFCLYLISVIVNCHYKHQN